jgi:electron transfer flavoprotein beta subunit
MGADRALLLEVAQDLEPLCTAKYLASVIRHEKPDLVLMGKQSTDHDYAQTPAMLAGLLGWPQALQASRVEPGEQALQVTCEVDMGTETLHVPLPAVISTDLRLNTPRYATLPAVMKAKRKPLEVLDPVAFEPSHPLQPRMKVLRAAAAPAHRAGRILPDVAALVAALRDESRVL